MAQERADQSSVSIVRNGNGEIIFEDSGSKVRRVLIVARQSKTWQEAEETFLKDNPGLTPEHLKAGILYYIQHPADIEREIESGIQHKINARRLPTFVHVARPPHDSGS